MTAAKQKLSLEEYLAQEAGAEVQAIVNAGNLASRQPPRIDRESRVSSIPLLSARA